jgi:N-glycosylase/DNA lyase
MGNQNKKLETELLYLTKLIMYFTVERKCLFSWWKCEVKRFKANGEISTNNITKERLHEVKGELKGLDKTLERLKKFKEELETRINENNKNKTN